MKALNELSTNSLVELITHIESEYDFDTSPMQISRQKLLSVLKHFPTDVLHSALKDLEMFQSNPIKDIFISSGLELKVRQSENDEEAEEDYFECPECGEQFGEDLDEEEDEIVCPECGLDLNSSDEEE